MISGPVEARLASLFDQWKSVITSPSVWQDQLIFIFGVTVRLPSFIFSFFCLPLYLIEAISCIAPSAWNNLLSFFLFSVNSQYFPLIFSYNFLKSLLPDWKWHGQLIPLQPWVSCRATLYCDVHGHNHSYAYYKCVLQYIIIPHMWNPHYEWGVMLRV